MLLLDETCRSNATNTSHSSFVAHASSPGSAQTPTQQQAQSANSGGRGGGGRGNRGKKAVVVARGMVVVSANHSLLGNILKVLDPLVKHYPRPDFLWFGPQLLLGPALRYGLILLGRFLLVPILLGLNCNAHHKAW